VVTTINITKFNLLLSASSNPAFEGTSVILSSSSALAYTVLAWEPAYLFPFQNAATQRMTADTSRTVTVTGESSAGCIDTARLFVEIKTYNDFFVPNAFSPNGDGKNDIFIPMGTTISKGKMRIFNQWGGMLFETENISQGWNGMSKGKLQPVGIYVYEVQVTMLNGSLVSRKGYVNLIR
jgi:gliding motility-associated-like protein